MKNHLFSGDVDRPRTGEELRRMVMLNWAVAAVATVVMAGVVYALGGDPQTSADTAAVVKSALRP